jgi:hypothetical protein
VAAECRTRAWHEDPETHLCQVYCTCGTPIEFYFYRDVQNISVIEAMNWATYKHTGETCSWGSWEYPWI